MTSWCLNLLGTTSTFHIICHQRPLRVLPLLRIALFCFGTWPHGCLVISNMLRFSQSFTLPRGCQSHHHHHHHHHHYQQCHHPHITGDRICHRWHRPLGFTLLIPHLRPPSIPTKHVPRQCHHPPPSQQSCPSSTNSYSLPLHSSLTILYLSLTLKPSPTRPLWCIYMLIFQHP